jgi:hypothetical protein
LAVDPAAAVAPEVVVVPVAALASCLSFPGRATGLRALTLHPCRRETRDVRRAEALVDAFGVGRRSAGHRAMVEADTGARTGRRRFPVRAASDSRRVWWSEDSNDAPPTLAGA